MSVFFIGIAGYSGSGKSSIARYLEDQGIAQRFRFDVYYKTLEDCPKLLDGSPNWELPTSLYLDQAAEDLARVREGQPTMIPIYSRKRNTVTGEELFTPEPIIILEGMHLFSHEKIRNMLDLRVWLDVTKDIALARRLSRHPDFNSDYYQNVMLPAIHAYLDPAKEHAHIILDANRLAGDVISDVVEIIKEHAPQN